MGADKELLDELLRHTGYMYISDLRRPDTYKKIKETIDTIKLHHYSAEEWCDAYTYITGVSVSGSTEEEIRILIERLK